MESSGLNRQIKKTSKSQKLNPAPPEVFGLLAIAAALSFVLYVMLCLYINNRSRFDFFLGLAFYIFNSTTI